MTTTPDPFDLERSRAAVAVACLQWLKCTGPAIELESGRGDPAETSRDRPRIEASIPAFDPDDWPHPLWDRWIDG